VWRPAEIPSVSREVTEHTLNIKPESKHVKQGLPRFNQEKRKAIGEELVRLIAASFVKEAQHLNWIANPVLVPKNNGKWRMCVDYCQGLVPRVQRVPLDVGLLPSRRGLNQDKL
jgi:hypothetical protein